MELRRVVTFLDDLVPRARAMSSAQTIAQNVRTHTRAQTPIQTPFKSVAQTTLRRRYHLGSLGIYRDMQLRITQTATGRLRLRSAVVTATARHPKPLT